MNILKKIINFFRTRKKQRIITTPKPQKPVPLPLPTDIGNDNLHTQNKKAYNIPDLSKVNLRYGGIPSNIELIEEDILEGDLLPVIKERKYGYGRRYNAYITPNGHHYHKNKCLHLAKNKQLIHLYNAIMDSGLKPCTHCKPRKQLEKWYTEMFPYVSTAGGNP